LTANNEQVYGVGDRIQIPSPSLACSRIYFANQ